MFRKLKYIFPKGLFARFVLIVTVPIILAQFVGIYMFYYRHWDSVSEDISNLIVQELRKSKSIFTEIVNWGGDYEEAIKIASIETGFDLHFIPNAKLEKEAKISKKNLTFERERFYYKYLNVFDSLNRLKIELKKEFKVPFAIYEAPDKRLIIKLQLNEGIFEYNISKKRIVYSSTYIFTLWVIGISILVISISIIFLRNQIRSIKNLTKAAKKFGKGIDVPNYKPSGAREIRSAGLEFIKMRDRIKRQIAQRTEMLACVSHDLRTPLTRVKLQLEMMKGIDGVELIKADIRDMEEMVDEYLDFAKGDFRKEEKKLVNLLSFMKKLASMSF
ncbi:histidine kinase dimerization/phospho-acceptor domain-containing protein [Pseudomonadota bacterium]